MKFSSLEYIDENKNQMTIIQNNNEKLSPISLSILDSIFNTKVTIIFSQGPLNLSPIISSLFAFQKEQDVLIGIPKRLFHERFEKNTDIFFSLLYKQKMDVGTSNALYFYREMLWCKGEIDEETNELINLDISTRPKHGTSKFKREYDNYARESLTSGTFQTRPKVLSITIDEVIPAGIIGENKIKFENSVYTLKNFSPKLIIYDSINERKYSFSNICELIKKIENMEIKLVLHFSWPYLKGLSEFLEKIKDNNSVNVIHLGKRICIESQKNFIKPAQNILPLSLEGKSWENYYPKRRFFNFKIIVVPPKAKPKNLSAKDVENWDWHLDERITEIREHLKYEPFIKFKENLFKFPPVVDTFLCPSEIKIWSPLIGKSIPITKFISIKENEASPSIRAFKGLCSVLEKYRDLSYEFRGLYTNSAITKKTLFQAFFIEKINNIFKETVQKNFQDSDHETTTSILIANFHPHSYLKTQTSLAESLIYLLKSINYSIRLLNIPNIQKKNNLIYIEKELYNGEKQKEIIWENNFIEEFNLNKIKRFFLNNIPEVNISISKNNNQLHLIMRLNISLDYIEYLHQNSNIDIKYFNGLNFYEAIITNDGSFKENKLYSISFENTVKNSVIKMMMEHKSDVSPKEIFEKDITTIHTDFSNMQALSQELITNSELIIPGPIPFTTISDDDILIFHGYDALLLPFKSVIFFAYPGNNFKYILKQTKLYNDLLSENQTNISTRDLLFSLDNIKSSKRFKLPPKPDSNIIQTQSNEIDTPIDTAIREELLNESNADENEQEEIRTLKDIWAQAQQKSNNEPQKRSIIHNPSKEYINFDVKFEDGTKDTISFQTGILIRKKYMDDYILSTIDELSENDQIIYIQSDGRDSVENHLLKTILSEDEMSLEEITKPLTALKIFYETIHSLNFKQSYDEIKMKKFDWLSPEQKENIFDIFSILFSRDQLISQNNLALLIDSSIWKGIIKPEILMQIFERGANITYSKLFNLAECMGLNYKENSFKQLCSTAINEDTHYSFHDEKNVLAIGRLIGHMGIIENYQIINDKGSRIGTFLRQVGRSINRVANGKGDIFNEMDIAIEEKMKKCTIVKIRV
ncbi:Uncharacterised protein [uncultured archaeon]|nr:Uncharacterised protein [uncultured archaeon]